MEIFAGAAVLTSMAMAMGLPVAAPIDIKLDGTNLLDPKVRNEIEAHIDAQDPYCVTFAPVCGLWTMGVLELPQHAAQGKHPRCHFGTT